MLLYIIYILTILEYGIHPKQYENALNEIQAHEGFRSHIYTVNGYGYIGYGHLIKKYEDYSSIDSSEAKWIMNQDLLCNIDVMYKATKLKGNKLLSISMLSYNIGSGKVRGYIKKGLLDDYSRILSYNKFKQNGKLLNSNKLAKRRAYEYALYNL